MEARIFMKFYMVINYYLVNLSLKFHEDPCINARAQVINARSHDFSEIYENKILQIFNESVNQIKKL